MPALPSIREPGGTHFVDQLTELSCLSQGCGARVNCARSTGRHVKIILPVLPWTLKAGALGILKVWEFMTSDGH